MKKFYGSIVWFLATLFVVYSFCLNTAAAVFAESVKNSLHTGNLGASIGMGGFILGFACMQIPAGYWLDRYNPRFVVSSGVFLLALGNILISLADNLALFTLSNLLQGIGASFAFTAIAVLISQWFAAKLFPILFGLTQTISCIMAAILHYWFSLELGIHSWNFIYQKLAMFGIVLLVLTLLLVKSPADYQREAPLSLGKSLTTVLKNKQILLCTFAAATAFGVLLAYASLWFLPVQKFYGVSDLDAIIIGGMMFIGIGLGTPIWGWVSNRVKSRTAVLHITMVLGTMVLLLGIYLPHYQIQTLVIVKTVSFFIGFLLSGSMLFYTVVSEISTDRTRGVALSVTNTGVFLVNTAMLFVPYLLVTLASTEFFTYLWIFPFLTMASVLLNYFVKNTYAD